MALEADSRDVWPCPLTATGRRSAHSTCAKAFAKEYDFQVVETSDDGNCFFYSLIKFGKRLNFSPLNQDVLSLRKRLVDHIEDHMDEYIPYLSNNNAGTPEEQIETLREDGVWASEAGDLVPLAATNAFNLPIDLYNIEDHGDQDVIRRIPLRPSSSSSSSSLPPIPLSILRVREGHFQLLWPRSAPSASSSMYAPSTLSHASKPIQNSSKEEIMTATRAAVEAAQIAVQTAKRVISPSRSSSVATSLSKNEHNLKQMTRQLNQLNLNASLPSSLAPSLAPAPSSRRVTRSTARASAPLPTRSPPRRKAATRKKKNSPSRNASFYVNNNNNLQRAIQASLQ